MSVEKEYPPIVCVVKRLLNGENVLLVKVIYQKLNVLY